MKTYKKPKIKKEEAVLIEQISGCTCSGCTTHIAM